MRKKINTPRGYSNRSNYRSEHDEETAYDSYMNPEFGFRAGPHLGGGAKKINLSSGEAEIQ